MRCSPLSSVFGEAGLPDRPVLGGEGMGAFPIPAGC